MTALAMSFQETKFSVVDRNGQVWLRASELAEALGYARPDALNKIYERNADEFTASMTTNVKMTFNGINNSLRETDVRIFSLRGAHLIAMFARTAVAKEFRRWVLDILDREVLSQAINKRVVVSTEQKNVLQQLVATRCGNSQKLRAEMWTRHNNHFNVHSYHELLAIRFEDSKQYLQTMELRTKPEATAPTAPPQDAFNLMFNGVRTKMTEYVCQLQNELISRGGQVPKFPAFDKDAIAAETIQSIVRNRRMFMTFDHEGQPQVKFVPSDCYVIRESELPKMIEDGNGVSKSLLPDIMQSVMKRLGLAAK